VSGDADFKRSIDTVSLLRRMQAMQAQLMNLVVAAVCLESSCGTGDGKAGGGVAAGEGWALAFEQAWSSLA